MKKTSISKGIILSIVTILTIILSTSCGKTKKVIIYPEVITQQVKYDTDDPAIWVNKQDITKSIIVGTDKDKDGAIYAFNLDGKIINKIENIKRPNNIDVAYNFPLGDTTLDIAVFTERLTNCIRVFSMPDLKELDNGGIPVFEDEEQKAPMGISLYTKYNKETSRNDIYAIVSRKEGPTDGYLHQYLLYADSNNVVKGTLVRKFGKFSGIKEIEAIAVDNELGYIYYSDEQHSVRKYYADPSKGNQELASISTKSYKADNEGISIYKNDDGTGYIFVSNQDNTSFKVYPREGYNNDKHNHPELAEFYVTAKESDGSEVVNLNFGPKYPKGLFVAMSTDKTFHYYDCEKILKEIDRQRKENNK